MSRTGWLLPLLLPLSTLATVGQMKMPAVTMESAPERPIIELRDGIQFLNFDMIVRNMSSVTLRISQIEVSVYDSAEELVLRKSLNTDAFVPSIVIIGEQVFAPGASLDVFNPFSEFASAVPLVRLDYSLCLWRESNAQERGRNRHRLPDDCDFRQHLTVRPRIYENTTPLVLPLPGRIFVWEGHDFYAHHSRVPLSDPKVRSLGITANSNNFALDFIYLDAKGRKYHDSPQQIADWYSYGRPICAPGAGVVLATANDIPENWFDDAHATRIGHPKLRDGQDPKDIGNFVLIDHQDGEYSLLVHMKPGSVAVIPGERLRQGQFIGRIGFSGDSIFPHLHYSLMNGPEVFKAWGLPAYFSNFSRILGTNSVRVNRGPVDSGDFLESEAPFLIHSR